MALQNPQENAYNPYYTFVCQHFCKSSHLYKITLQYCLLDLLRDLGEDSVSGIEVLRNLEGSEDGFEVKDVSSNKMRNVANAYAWWVAKVCIALPIFKVRSVDYSNIRVTEPPQLPACGLYRTEAPNT